jgi:hypothetical protein
MTTSKNQSIRSAAIGAALALLLAMGLAVSSAQAAETSNRIAANRIAANRIAANRIAANRIAANKLSADRLEANSDSAEILSTADGREVYSYMMSCALPARMSMEATIPGAPDTKPPATLYTCSGERCRFPGSIGLAEYWVDRPLDGKGQRWVSACLLARVNLYGVKVVISMRGVAPELSVSPDEAQKYSLQEGAFYGNIFADPDKPLDWNACRGRDQAAEEIGGLKLRDCTEPDPNDPSHTKCGFNYAGDCGNYSSSFHGPHACKSFDPDDGSYGECAAPKSADEGETTSSRRYREVITTYVKHP